MSRYFKGYSLSLNTLVALLIGVVVLLIIAMALYITVFGNIKDMENTQLETGSKIPPLLPALGIILHKKRGSISINTIVYLLLGIIVASIIVLGTASLVDKGKSTNPPINDTSLKLECSKKCSLNENFEECYRECVKNISIGGERHEKRNN